MKKQIVFIHGGNAFCQYENFLTYLKNKEIEDPFVESAQKRWQPSLREVLSETYEVCYPSMPNSKNAKYAEWKIWFEKHHAFLRDGVILIGHSLGGYFLAKYLSEEKMSVTVRALYLLAAPFENDDFDGEDGGDFAFDPMNLPRLAGQVGAVYILHSKDDPVVPYAHALKYKEALPTAELILFEDRNHFILEEFPELIEHIEAHDE
jgi:predicted alpha/beta hydrolase family esterase